MMDSLDYTLEEHLNENNENDDNNNFLESVKLKELDSTISIESRFDPNKQNDLNQIIEMGFNQKMAKKVFILLNPVDINQAIDFLTQEEGIYHHDFLERHGKNDECFICGCPFKNHINYIPPVDTKKIIIQSIRNSLGLPNKNVENIDEFSIGVDNKEDGDKKKSPYVCDLCFEDMTEEEKDKNTIECGHLFCSDCYLNYLLDKINNNKVGRINCMEHTCGNALDEDFIISHLNDEKIINKYKKFKLRDELYNDPNVKFCPIKDCESYARKSDENEKYVTCLEGHQFCFVCMKPWHGKIKCQDEIDIDFKKWKKNKVVKKCPKCKMWTEKNLGCNHMTCAQCKYQWCWLCGGKYTDNHFQIGGSCSGLQFAHSNLFNNCFCLYLYKTWVLFYQMIIMLFIIPIAGFTHTLKETDDYNIDNCCVVMYAYITWFLWCIPNLCLYILLGAFLFIISIFFHCIRENLLEKVFDSY